jgi:hypothetical protein
LGVAGLRYDSSEMRSFTAKFSSTRYGKILKLEIMNEQSN